MYFCQVHIYAKQRKYSTIAYILGIFVMQEPVIHVEHFAKAFGEHKVVRDLSFDVQKGEIFALLGANGSGKTTTIRCLLGIYHANSGTLHVLGKPYAPALSRMLGYLPEERGLYTTSHVLETIVYIGMLKGLPRAEAEAWSRAYLDRVELAGKAQDEIKRLSSGQQQKIQLGMTMIGDPELLILDEPTKGFDPVNRDLLMEMLMERNRAGATIIFITHQMDEVERIADRLLMLKDGTAALYGGVEDVRNQFGQNTIQLEFTGTLKEHPELFSVSRRERNTAVLVPRDGIETDAVLAALLADNVKLQSFARTAPSLQDIFVQISRNHGT